MPITGPSSNQLPGYVTNPSTVGQPASTNAIEQVDALTSGSQTNAPDRAGGLSQAAAAGEVSYAQDSLDGMDWEALAKDGSLAANLSVSITAIATMLIEILAEMRKSSKEAGLEEAQNALETGLAAAEKMEDAAKSKFMSSVISASMSMAMSVVQMRMATSAQTMQAPEPQIQAYNALSQAYQGIGNSVAKLVTSFLDYGAAIQEAEAQKDRSTAEYQQSIAQAQKDFAAQINDSISKALAFMAKISDVLHQATGAIYGM